MPADFSHGAAPLGQVHVPYNWSYADAAARGAATGLVAGDVGKLARQLDDNSLWLLTATTPTWVAVGGAGGASDLDGLSDVVIASPAAGHVLMHDGTDWDNRALTGRFPVHFQGGGSALASGLFTDVAVPYDATITGWRLVGDGDVVIDVWKDSYANFPPTVADTVAGTEKPTLSGVTKNEDASLTTWTDTTWLAGEQVRFSVEAGAAATWATLWVSYTRTGA